MKKKYLGIIPARAGSKGIPQKNFRLLAGKPMVSYTFGAAIACAGIDRLVLSSNCSEVIKLAKEAGIEVPFVRPEEICADNTPMLDVLLHCVNFMQKQMDYHPDAVVLLQPTSPLRLAKDIENAIKVFEKEESESLFSVNPVSQHPCEYIRENNQGGWDFVLQPPEKVSGRQEYPDCYFINGAIYITATEFLFRKKAVFDGNAAFSLMPVINSVDIDNDADWLYAEALIGKREKENIT
ncbi:cytidylyltransferase domain-containing protein [Candidatus Riflebacteria bacterium]